MSINLWDLATLSEGSEASGYESENTQHIWIDKKWRSSGNSDWIAGDFGAQYGIDAIVIDGHNITSGLTTFKVQGSNDDFVSTPLDENFTFNADIIMHFFGSTQTYQYIKILANDANLSYIQFSRIYVGSFINLSKNPDSGFNRPSTDLSLTGINASNNHFSRSNNRQKSFRYGYGGITAADKVNLNTIWDEVRGVKPFYICQDPDSRHDTTFYVQFSNKLEFEHIIRDSRYNTELDMIEAK